VYDYQRASGELQPESFEYSGEMAGETSQFMELESPFSEAEEMELAAELLMVSSEAEMERFLGNFFKKAWKGIKSVGAKVLPVVGGVLKTVAKTALPIAATAAGTFFGGPLGGAIGGKLGSLVSQALEAETAGMDAMDRDLEKCRRFVRMAGTAARTAALATPGTDPAKIARNALAASAERKLAQAVPARKAALAGVPTATAPSPASRMARTAAPPSGTFGRPAAPAGFGPSMANASPPARAAPPARGAAPAGIGMAASMPCKPCGCKHAVKHPANCTCCKCRNKGQSGRWIRTGNGIVIINC
jgi:hypothetical protein